MIKRFAIAISLATALWGYSALVCAADFYVLYFSKEEESALILDPLSITDTPEHHRNIHIINISSHGMWNDETMEMDCAGNRWKSLSSISHMAGTDSVDHAADNNGGTWAAIDKASPTGHEFDVACNWPAAKDHLELYQSADALTAKRAISQLLNN